MNVVYLRKLFGICFLKRRCFCLYGFLKTYFTMVTNIKDYVTPVFDEYGADFGCLYRDTMIAQFKQGFYNKNFSLQDQNKGDQSDTLQNRFNFWLNIFDMGVQYLIFFMIMIITTRVGSFCLRCRGTSWIRDSK